MTLTGYQTGNGIGNITLYLPKSAPEGSFTNRKTGELKDYPAVMRVEGSKGDRGRRIADPIYLFAEISLKYSISGFKGYLRGRSTAMMYEQFGELKFKYRSR